MSRAIYKGDSRIVKMFLEELLSALCPWAIWRVLWNGMTAPGFKMLDLWSTVNILGKGKNKKFFTKKKTHFSYKEVRSVWWSLVTVCTFWEGADEDLPFVLGSLWSFFHFILLFWNQILICRSERHRLWAISILRRLVRYLLKWNSFSSSRTCCLV